MVYHGHVKNGLIVIDGGQRLPEGMSVRIEPVKENDASETVWERLLRHSGRVKDLPADAAENHDHYLYDSPES